MSNSELDAMAGREQLILKVLLPVVVLLLFGWGIFNGRQSRPEPFDDSSLNGCYASESGLGVAIEEGRLRLLSGEERSIAFVITREKIGLTIVPEATITVLNGTDGPAFQVADRKASRWIPNLVLRRFAPEARYTVVDIAKTNGFTMRNEHDASSVDFRRDPSCRR